MNYLSNAWIFSANQALSAAASTFGPARLELVQRIKGVRTYVIRVGAGTAALEIHDGETQGEVALCFEQDWATACAIAQGHTDAHQAFLLGDITFAGDISILLANADALDHIEAALGPVMSKTVFPANFTA